MTWWEDAARAESRDWRYDPDDGDRPDAAEVALNREDAARRARQAAAAARNALNQKEGP